MIERIFSNWKNTLIGTILIIVPLIFVWFEKASLEEVGIFWGIVLAGKFFYEKDK